MKHRTTLVSLAFFAFTGWARADDKPYRVPFETLKTQHIVVMAKLNGKGPYRLIFDTGAPVTLLSNKIARDSGVLAKDDKKPALIFFGELPQYKIKTLELGDLKSDNVKTMVMDHPTIAAIDKAVGPVEGIIGLTFFARYRMTIDYQAKEMTFVPVNFTPPDVLKGLLAMLNNPGKQKRVLAPLALWGFNVAEGSAEPAAGVTVKEVLAGGPAALGGLKAGDRLLSLEGRWTDSVTDCYQAASFVRPGTAARLVVMREGKEVELTVRVLPGL
jgi:Aspartyl protease/PDZ domain